MEATMNAGAAGTAAAATAPRRRGRLLRYALYAVLALTLIALVAHVFWRFSGNGSWELAIDEGGVKVWTSKMAGDDYVRIKSETRVKASLSAMIKLLEDLESCVDAHCYDASVLQPIPSTQDRYAAFVRFKFDLPGMKTRDYVLLQEHYQDPATRQIDINIIAAPNRIPRDACCVRVTHLHNHWTLKPAADGMVDIEFMQDTDIGGVPYPLANLALTQGTHEIMKGMQALMDMPKYRDAKVAYIQDAN